MLQNLFLFFCCFCPVGGAVINQNQYAAGVCTEWKMLLFFPRSLAVDIFRLLRRQETGRWMYRCYHSGAMLELTGSAFV